MTIKECIDIVDDLKPNQYSIKVKVMWLSFIDEIIINDVLKTHKGYDGRYDNFTGYSEDKLSVPLIVESPYDRLYTAYLKMKIDGENGETTRYNNSAGLFNSYMMEYRKFYNKTHLPLSEAEKRAIIPANKNTCGISEAELENLERKIYARLQEDFLRMVSDDKLYSIVSNYVINNIEMLKENRDIDLAIESIKTILKSTVDLIDGKVDKEDNKGLSTNDFTDDDKATLENALQSSDIDNDYNPKSENAQSGIAVAEAVKNTQPIVVDSINEMTDTRKSYVLSTTGEIWTYQAHESDGKLIPNFTNLFDKNKVLVNKVFDAANSAPTDYTGYYVTGPFLYDFSNYDITNPLIVRIKGGVNTSKSRSRVAYYRDNTPTDLANDVISTYAQFTGHMNYEQDEDGVVSFKLGVRIRDGVEVAVNDLQRLKGFAFSFYLAANEISIDDVPDLIITVDEEITYTEAPEFVYEWVGTGLYYGLENCNQRSREPEEIVLPNFTCVNDFTFVGDEIWSSETSTNITKILRYKIINGELTKSGEIVFNDVIHLNTMDYCPETDCFITGNGANDTNTEGNCFWIIPNASNLPNLSGWLNLSDVAIRYDVDIGYKVQAIWGDGNLGQHNLVYLFSNDNEVRRAIIHKNPDGSFANTFTIVGEPFTITGAAGFQGVDYYGGYIYMGHGTFKLSKIDTSTFKAVTIEYPYCFADGTVQNGTFQGVVVDKDYIWLYPNGIKNENGEIVKSLVRYLR